MHSEFWIPDKKDFPYDANKEDFVEAILLEIVANYRIHFYKEIEENPSFLSDFVFLFKDWVLKHINQFSDIRALTKIPPEYMTHVVGAIVNAVFETEVFKDKKIKLNDPMLVIYRLLKNYKETRSEEVVPESPPRGKSVYRIMPEHESDLRSEEVVPESPPRGKSVYRIMPEHESDLNKPKRLRMMATINGWNFF
tara:strand:+ start:81 stop:665 length:585 start_codon:yes stop_codon:yes gene_type:complete